MQFEYNFPVDASTYRERADRIVRETRWLLDDPGWTPQRTRAGVTVDRRALDVRPHAAWKGDPARTSTHVTRGSIRIAAPRDRVFALLSLPERAHEWDPMDRGGRTVERFDADHQVFHGLTKPPSPAHLRDTLLLTIRREDEEPGLSLYCVRSVCHRDMPSRESIPRLAQHVFAWTVREISPTESLVTVLVSVPDGLPARGLLEAVSVQSCAHLLRSVEEIIGAETAAHGGSRARRAEQALPSIPNLATAVRYLAEPDRVLREAHRGAPEVFMLDVMSEPWTILTGQSGLKFFFGLTGEDVDPFEFRLRMPTLNLPGVRPPSDLLASTRLTKTLLGSMLQPERSERRVGALCAATQRSIAARLDPVEGEIEDTFRFLLEVCVAQVAHTLLGQEVARRLPPDFTSTYADVELAVNLPLLVAPWLPVPPVGSLARAMAAKRRLVPILLQMVAERRREESAASGSDDLLGRYLHAKRPDGSSFDLSDAEIAWLINAMHWAAHHYPAVHAFWAGVEIFRRPEVLEKIREEQSSLGDIDASTVSRMGYLQGCLKECIRLHPVTTLPRKVLRTLSYRGYRIPAGTTVAISPYLEHHDARIYPEPEAFRPERWLDPEHPIPNWAFVAGGGGTWGCVGMRLTLQMLSVLWANLFRHLDFEIVGELPENRTHIMSIPPDRPVRMRYRRRAPLPRSTEDRAPPMLSGTT